MFLSGGAAPVAASSASSGGKGAANGWGVGHLESGIFFHHLSSI